MAEDEDLLAPIARARELADQAMREHAAALNQQRQLQLDEATFALESTKGRSRIAETAAAGGRGGRLPGKLEVDAENAAAAAAAAGRGGRYTWQSAEDGRLDQEESLELAERLAELRIRLSGRLAAAPPADAAFAVDLLVAQARELWELRRALRRARSAAATATAEAAAGWQSAADQKQLIRNEHGYLQEESTAAYASVQSEMRALADEALRAKRLEHQEGAICAELVEEASRISIQAQTLEERERLRDEELKKLRSKASEVNPLRHELRELQRQLEQTEKQSGTDLFEAKCELQDLRQKNEALQQYSNQLLNKLERTGGKDEATTAASTSLQPSSSSSTIPWHDGAQLYDHFATREDLHSPARMRPAEFGHVCESYRRHKGLGPSRVADRQQFAEFAFVAVFGSASSEVTKRQFERAWPEVAPNLEELEQMFYDRMLG